MKDRVFNVLPDTPDLRDRGFDNDTDTRQAIITRIQSRQKAGAKASAKPAAAASARPARKAASAKARAARPAPARKTAKRSEARK